MKDWIEKEGPTIQNIPARSYLSCSGCKFYDHHMVRSGQEPIYANDCTHPNVPKEHKFTSWMRGNLGDSKETPEWCPLEKK